MKSLFLLFVILFSTKVFSYPKECTEIESKLIELISQVNAGKDPSQEVKAVVPKMDAVTHKYPECKKMTIPLTQKLVSAIDDFVKREKEKDAKAPKNQIPALTSAEVVTYDEWFTLQQIGIKSGKKYSFVACVIGSRNATAARCHVSGSAARRVFYNTDDIQDLNMKKKWVNTINENKCVTAYVTGSEAFIVSISDINGCK